MTRYNKGARSEREILGELHGMGFSVMRSAGSGVSSLCPDLVAFKNGRGIALECKAWERDNLSIEHDQYNSLVEWANNTKMDTFVAWRMNGTGWFFIKLDELKKNEKSMSISRKTAFSINRRLESIIQ